MYLDSALDISVVLAMRKVRWILKVDLGLDLKGNHEACMKTWSHS